MRCGIDGCTYESPDLFGKFDTPMREFEAEMEHMGEHAAEKHAFHDVLPECWTEDIEETLSAIYDEATDRTTEFMVKEGVVTQEINIAVSRLRARAVVLAHEIERLRNVDR